MTSTKLDATEAFRTPVERLIDERRRRRRVGPLLDSLSTFVREAWPIVEPFVSLRWNWHLDAICGELERVTAGEIDRLIINVSPGSCKSLLVSVFWPCWEWARQPHLRYLCASHSDALAVRDNLRCRDVILSEWFQDRFTLRLAGYQNEKTRFNTTAGGHRIGTGVGGVATGEHPDRIILDDVHKAAQASSDVERTRALRWFDRTIATRGLIRDVRIVLIMQRLHENDLSGHLLDRGGWQHICFPMRYELDRSGSELDVRTKEGELFWPEMFSEETVAQLELDLGVYGAAGQLQQRPAPEGAGLFSREWFEIVDAVPANAERVRGWDIAATADGGDYTAGVKISRSNGYFYVEDVRRGQLSAAAVDALIAQTAALDGRACKQREEIEPGAAGKSVIAARARMLAGYDYAGVSVTGSKIIRAGPLRAQAQAGNVKVLRAPWVDAFLGELETFPVGAHDDMVDGASAAFNVLTSEPGPLRVAEARWG